MDAQITNIVELAVLGRMRAKASFTALDISNALKADRYPIRHGQVAATVRNIFASGAMGYYDFDRKLIDVVTDGGAKKTQAFLYLHTETREREYTSRSQASLPLVAPDQARDLSDSVATSPLPLLPRPTRRARKSARTYAASPRSRQDGALAIPRALVDRLGWHKGVTLGLRAENRDLVIRPQATAEDVSVQVWGGGRVRVCKTKLLLGALVAEQVTVEVEGDSLRLSAERKNNGGSAANA